MTQTPSTPQAGASGDPQPQAGDPTTTPTPQAGSGKTSDDYERMITQLRAENAANRVKLKKHEDDEAARNQAQMTELQLAQKQAADLQEQNENIAAELLEERVYKAVAKVAGKMNFILPPDMLADLLIKNFNAIEFEDGKPTNVEKLLEKLAKDAPKLVEQPAQQQQQQPGAPQLPAMNPGRSTITQPGQGQPGRIPRLSDRDLWKR